MLHVFLSLNTSIITHLEDYLWVRIIILLFAINLFQMENTIKQSESERERGLETLRRLHEEYKPLKRDIDKMRGSLGLEKVANLDEESSLAE